MAPLTNRLCSFQYSGRIEPNRGVGPTTLQGVPDERRSFPASCSARRPVAPAVAACGRLHRRPECVRPCDPSSRVSGARPRGPGGAVRSGWRLRQAVRPWDVPMQVHRACDHRSQRGEDGRDLDSGRRVVLPLRAGRQGPAVSLANAGLPEA